VDLGSTFSGLATPSPVVSFLNTMKSWVGSRGKG